MRFERDFRGAQYLIPAIALLLAVLLSVLAASVGIPQDETDWDGVVGEGALALIVLGWILLVQQSTQRDGPGASPLVIGLSLFFLSSYVDLLDEFYDVRAVSAFELLKNATFVGAGIASLGFFRWVQWLQTTEQNARVHQRTRQQAEQMASLNQVGLTLLSTLDLDEQLWLLFQQVNRLMELDSFYIALYDRNQGEVSFKVLVEKGERQPSFSRPFSSRGGVTEWIIESGEELLIDKRKELRDLPVSPVEVGVLDRIQSLISLPLMAKGEVIGVISVQSLQPHAFDEDARRFLSAIASYGVLAIESARLYEKTQRQVRELKMLQRAGATITSTLELDETLQLIIDAAVKAIPAAEKGSLHLFDEEQGQLVMRARYRFSDDLEEASSFQVGEGYTGWVFTQREPAIIDNVNTDVRTKRIDLPEMIAEKSAISVPLVVKDAAIGTITLDNTVSFGAFDERDLAVLTAFGNQAAIAIENARLYEGMKRQAITDGLTGLHNNRYFYQQLRSEIARSERYGHRFSLIMLDIDNFKHFNDRYGHLIGDDLLQGLAQILLTTTRQADTVARYGGEEFVIVLPETRGQEGEVLAERLRRTVEEFAFEIGEEGRQGHITISAGVAAYPEHGETPKALVGAADKALMAAKDAGKNRVRAHPARG